MDKSAVKRIVERELGPLMERLGIASWSIVANCDLKPEGDGNFNSRGECNWHADYDKAVISFCPDAFEDERELIECLRHELFHVVLAPTSIFLNAIRPALEGDTVRKEMADSVFSHMIERLVINLERMYLGLTRVEAVPKRKGGRRC